MRQERQEPVDDGDVRPASGLFALKGRTPAARPRLAWRPWLRGFIIGALFGAFVVAIIGYFVLARLAEKVGAQPFGWWR